MMTWVRWRPGEPIPWDIPTRAVHSLFWHCSASPHAHHTIDDIRRWHTDPVDRGGRGWSDIGYHFFIDFDGVLWIGRDWELTPAAQAGHNTGTLAGCVHGLSHSDFTAAQMATVKAVAIDLTARFKRARGIDLRHRGHREVAAKACPVFDYRRVIGEALDGTPIEIPDFWRPDADADTAAGKAEAWQNPDLFDRGPNVARLQTALVQAGHRLVIDGIFGQGTRAAVVEFQRNHGLAIDGIVGPVTRKRLGL